MTGRNLVFAAALLLLAALAAWGLSDRRRDERLLHADPDVVLSDPVQAASAIKAGAHVFAERCADCHGPNGRGRSEGATGPDLTDADWLYGEGLAHEIEQTTAYGIRSNHPKGWNLAHMPSYAQPDPAYKIPPLPPADIRDVIAYLDVGRGERADVEAARRGQAIYSNRGGCYDCHGGDARGDSAIGAPNLVDHIWLYGDGSDADVFHSIALGRHGVMPAFIDSLSAVQLRQVAIYTYSLSHAGRDAPKEDP